MLITGYRVQSVLRTYTRRLQSSKLSIHDIIDAGPEDKMIPAGKLRIAEETRLRLIFEHLASQTRKFTGSTSRNDESLRHGLHGLWE